VIEHEAKDEEQIRRYLIGELAEDEIRRVEERIMSDREFSALATFVEDMLVDDYVEGRMEERDRESFEKLLLATPQGAEKVRFTRALKEYAANARPKEYRPKRNAGFGQSVFGLPRWALVAAAIFLIAAGMGIWRAIFFESDVDKGMIALNNAYRVRTIEARITGLGYVPRENPRGVGQEKVDYNSLRRSEILLRQATEEDPGAESFHALGRFYLAKGDFDQAIDQFKKAMELAPGDAQIYSDLGAAYLEKGRANERSRTGGGAEDFSQSLEYLNKAIDLDENLLESRFNRALVYERSSHTDQAFEEWREYLKRDSNSLWADEARANIEKLRSR